MLKKQIKASKIKSKDLFLYENKLWKLYGNSSVIVGVDEVGRGPLAGPIVGCAVAWTKEIIDNMLRIPHKKELVLQITDSKKLTPKKRTILSEFIKNECLTFSICEISAKDIDKSGVGEVNKKVLECAVSGILKKTKVSHVLVDYFSVCEDLNVPETALKNGDQLSFSIASASIVAKVYRDNLMVEYHNKYPKYGFNTNVGYGTSKHIKAIKEFGYTPIHRKSFKLKN